MKTLSLVIGILLLSLCSACTRQRQSTQNAQPNQSKETTGQTPSSAVSSDRGTPAEARAMLDKAVAHYNSVGRKQALADFTARKAPFADRDLYVACISSNHIIVANGAFPSLVGTSTDAWKDVEGKPVGRAIWEVASTTGSGSVEYRWQNPVSGKVEPKVLFVEKVGEDACGVGAYKPE